LAPAVLAYLRAQRVNEPEDLLGEVFLQVSRDAHKFGGDSLEDERRWIFAIARNRAIDARRRATRRPAISDQPVPEQPVPTVPDPVDPALVEALQQLTADQRDVLLLRFVADLGLEQVADLTGRNVNATKQLQHRALQSLRRVLAGEPALTDGE
jgi:RNA polymerase sigma-70 factor (ECF subfamily)